MSHSNSSLNCFTACQRKYQHCYILKTPPCRPLSPHLGFGTMAHEVLYKAGILRDNAEGVPNYDLNAQYETIIPSEVLYPEYKEYFGIDNWQRYFIPVCKYVAKYERELTEDILSQTDDKSTLVVEREIKLTFTPKQLEHVKLVEPCEILQPFTGVIDFLLLTKTHATIIDYKFSTNQKDQDDFDLNSQLQLYALFVHLQYNIPLRNIKFGYIDIPKKSFGQPLLLKNGTLSRAKSQNVSQEIYIAAVKAIHGDDADDMLDEGGYYHDIVNELALKKPAYLTTRYLDIDIYNNIIRDLFNTAKVVDLCRNGKLPFLARYDSYSCKSCEYLYNCKPWLTVNGAE